MDVGDESFDPFIDTDGFTHTRMDVGTAFADCQGKAFYPHTYGRWFLSLIRLSTQSQSNTLDILPLDNLHTSQTRIRTAYTRA